MSTYTNAKLTTVPTLSVQKTVDMLSDAYCAVIRQGLPMKTLPSVMLWGAPASVNRRRCGSLQRKSNAVRAKRATS